jgi:TRAP-type uncharacterized transport system substrate-binding protein
VTQPGSSRLAAIFLLREARGVAETASERGVRPLAGIVGPACFRLVVACAALVLASSASSQNAPRPAAAQPPTSRYYGATADEIWKIPDRNQINEGTVTIITAPAGGATSVFGSDMARVLDDEATIRVLPVLGKGPVRNVTDILYLKSIDMGAVAADVPEFYRLQYNIPDITSKLRYIAKLYHNEIHVIARSSIKSIYELEGKRVIAPTDVGFYSAKVIFSRLNIHASFDYATDDARSIQKIIDGEADAYITSTGKVFPLARNIKNENRALHLIPVPYDKKLRDMYLPTTFSGEEYPNLLAPDEKIETVAISVLLVSFDWPEGSDRYKKVARFVDAFFSRIDEFMKPPRHPKRFKAADDWLVQHNIKTSSQLDEMERAEFRRFLNENQGLAHGDPASADVLYRQFLEWRRKKGAPDAAAPR